MDSTNKGEEIIYQVGGVGGVGVVVEVVEGDIILVTGAYVHGRRKTMMAGSI